MSWTAPNNENACELLGYRVQVRLLNETRGAEVGADATSHTFLSLPAGDYLASVHARYRAGESASPSQRSPQMVPSNCTITLSGKVTYQSPGEDPLNPRPHAVVDLSWTNAEAHSPAARPAASKVNGRLREAPTGPSSFVPNTDEDTRAYKHAILATPSTAPGPIISASLPLMRAARALPIPTPCHVTTTTRWGCRL